MIIGTEHGLLHIPSSMTLELSYFGIKIPLSIFSSIKHTVMSMCLTLVVTILASTTEIKLVLSSQCTVCAPLWISKASMYLRKTLVLLTAFYMYLISPSVESEDISGLICTFHQKATPRRV